MRGDDTLSPCGRQTVGRGLLMTGASEDDIEQFVRGTLGCGCPDEVFRSMVVSRLPAVAGRPPIVQLLVGSRLLIHVVAPPTVEPSSGWIEQLAANGRSTRDRHGYNRFRLVVASPAPLTSARGLAERFARAVVGDDKAHLHFVGTDQLPRGIETPAPQGDAQPDLSRTVAK
jgi:hypothetical protein